jgi:hypothetical protein
MEGASAITIGADVVGYRTAGWRQLNVAGAGCFRLPNPGKTSPRIVKPPAIHDVYRTGDAHPLHRSESTR